MEKFNHILAGTAPLSKHFNYKNLLWLSNVCAPLTAGNSRMMPRLDFNSYLSLANTWVFPGTKFAFGG